MLAIKPDYRKAELKNGVFVEVRELLPHELTIFEQMWNVVKDEVNSEVNYNFLIACLGVVRYFTKNEAGEETTIEGLDFSKDKIEPTKEFFNKLMRRQAVPMKSWTKVVQEVNKINEDDETDLKN